MSDTHPEVKAFFLGYEAAIEMSDVDQIAHYYADVFMFGGPDGVQCVKKEDFVKVLPRRKEYFRSLGLMSTKVDSVEASVMDSKYIFVKTIWNMRFDRGSDLNAASYILSRSNDRYQIVFQIDHQDLAKKAREMV